MVLGVAMRVGINLEINKHRYSCDLNDYVVWYAFAVRFMGVSERLRWR